MNEGGREEEGRQMIRRDHLDIAVERHIAVAVAVAYGRAGGGRETKDGERRRRKNVGLECTTLVNPDPSEQLGTIAD